MTSETTAKKPHVQLTGQDGNIFFVIGRVRRAMRKAGVSVEEIERFSKDVMAAQSYHAAIGVVMKYVEEVS